MQLHRLLLAVFGLALAFVAGRSTFYYGRHRFEYRFCMNGATNFPTMKQNSRLKHFLNHHNNYFKVEKPRRVKKFTKTISLSVKTFAKNYSV